MSDEARIRQEAERAWLLERSARDEINRLREALRTAEQERDRLRGLVARARFFDGKSRIDPTWSDDVAALDTTPVASPPLGLDGARQPLTFEAFSEMNRWRCESNSGFAEPLRPSSSYTLAHWALSICSEAGEVCDAILGYEGLKARRAGKTSYDIALELADVVTYCDLAVSKLGHNLADVIAQKFNEVTDRAGFESKFKLPAALAKFGVAPTIDPARALASRPPGERKETT